MSCLKSGGFDLESIVFIVLMSTHAFSELYTLVPLCIYFSCFALLLLSKHHNQKQRREERICLAYGSHSKMKGRQAGARSGTGAEVMEECCLLLASSGFLGCLSYTAQAHLPTDATTCIYQSAIKKTSCTHDHGPIQVILQLNFPLPGRL